jgi:hypothetical protein
MVNVAGVFDLVLGLWFLKRFLRNFFPEKMQYFILLVTWLGTNLFFYSIEDTMMSHVYSFFAVSVFLFALQKFFADTSKYRYFLLMSLAFGLMIIIRHTNVIIGLCILFWDINSVKQFGERLRLMLQPKHILPLVGIVFIFLLPQLLYWKYCHGSYIYLKYGVGFSNWAHPKLAEIWFATLNGLFPYSPVLFFYVAGMIYMVWKRIPNGILILVLFLLISYIAAAYHVWYFGCGYGHRAFVEYFPLFCVPFGILMSRIISMKKSLLTGAVLLVIVVMAFLNIRMTTTIEKCNFGSTWDWDQFGREAKRTGLVPASFRFYSYKNDYENEALNYGEKLSETIFRSGMYSANLDKDRQFSSEHSAFVYNFSAGMPKTVDVRLWALKEVSLPTRAFVVSSIELNGQVIHWYCQDLDRFVAEAGKWFKVTASFPLPEGLTGDTQIRVYVWNPAKARFNVDDLCIRYE